ncbi:Glyoxalase/bleomycin resistance protein/dioxygenase [mine drainage metagenome]|uniref:Glyoxalase/bleomycin resistance protein/dioxygenase n=1 Tax=mine drainage metagenome TaxID=410659 RepID=T0Z592_9ZZZZ
MPADRGPPREAPGFRLHHVQLAIPPGGEAAASAFYEGLLGLAPLPKPAHLATRGGLWYSLGPNELHLGVEVGFRPATKAHPAFLVGDLEGLRRRLDEAGSRTYEDAPLPGYRRFYALDPFGNRLEFLTADSV